MFSQEGVLQNSVSACVRMAVHHVERQVKENIEMWGKTLKIKQTAKKKRK